MDEYMLKKTEDEEFNTSPRSVPMMTVKNKTEVMINCTKNKKLLGQVRAFGRHCNMVLENAKEMWEEVPKIVKGKKKIHPINNVVRIVLGYKYLRDVAKVMFLMLEEVLDIKANEAFQKEYASDVNTTLIS